MTELILPQAFTHHLYPPVAVLAILLQPAVVRLRLSTGLRVALNRRHEGPGTWWGFRGLRVFDRLAEVAA